MPPRVERIYGPPTLKETADIVLGILETEAVSKYDTPFSPVVYVGENGTRLINSLNTHELLHRILHPPTILAVANTITSQRTGDPGEKVIYLPYGQRTIAAKLIDCKLSDDGILQTIATAKGFVGQIRDIPPLTKAAPVPEAGQSVEIITRLTPEVALPPCRNIGFIPLIDPERINPLQEGLNRIIKNIRGTNTENKNFFRELTDILLRNCQAQVFFTPEGSDPTAGLHMEKTAQE